MNSQSKLSNRYRYKSVLESHHIATTLKILSKEEFNMLKNVTKEEANIIRKNIINNILATDVASN